MANVYRLPVKEMIIEDAVAAEELMRFCKDSASFYLHLANSVEIYLLRNCCFIASRKRRLIANDLREEIDGLFIDGLFNEKITKDDSQKLAIRQWYPKAENILLQNSDLDFFKQLMARERDTLAELRERVRKMQTSRFSDLMSFHVASIQITHDYMKSAVEVINYKKEGDQ